MNQTKLTIPTPAGPIEVVITNDIDYPGVRIDYQGQVIARVEYHDMDDQINGLLWEHGNDDYSYSVEHKPTKYRNNPQLERAYDELQTVLDQLDDEIVPLTEEQEDRIIQRIIGIDYSDYNEHLMDIVYEELN